MADVEALTWRQEILLGISASSGAADDHCSGAPLGWRCARVVTLIQGKLVH
jgi:hypothetical protein